VRHHKEIISIKNNKPVRDYLDTLYKKEKLNEQQYSVMKSLQKQGINTIKEGWGNILSQAGKELVKNVDDVTDSQQQQQMFKEKLASASKQIDLLIKKAQESNEEAFNAGVGAGETVAFTISALIASATVAGYQVYKRYLSAAGKACLGVKGWKAKTVCLKKYEYEAASAKAQIYQNMMPKCSQVKPEDKITCQERFQAKIKSARAKLQKK
jgi:hypothetical protein